MVSSDKKLANVVGGKSARACDNCVRKRAKWYCAADDAFLCQSCDSSVHSANPLARRHERVRLKTFDDHSRVRLRISVPSWHKGFTRKARTPRKNKNAKYNTATDVSTDVSIVLGIATEISGEAENEEELLYWVPIFDPFVAELCTSVNSNDAGPGFERGPKPEYGEFSPEMGHVQGFLPSEMDLAEFAADVESMLGKGLEDESFDIEALGILDDERERDGCLGRERVKVEDEESGGDGVDHHFIDGGYVGETFELNFDYDNGEGNDDGKELINMEPIITRDFGDSNKVLDSKKILLSLNYDGVMSAWDDHKSPWITGERPELNPDDCLSNSAGSCGEVHAYGVMGIAAAGGGGDGGREARVSRYREKRRTRLFSKKIRYEVRKLNAEKRPRMKGRFVKRANFVASAALISL